VATWDQLKESIHQAYTAEEISPRGLSMNFSTTTQRSQQVFVSFADDYNDMQWAQLDAPLGPLAGADLVLALGLVEKAACGGLCRLVAGGEELVTIRHCVPLAHLDWPEFDLPLRLVALAADGIRAELDAA
jgi:hypothetical protein